MNLDYPIKALKRYQDMAFKRGFMRDKTRHLRPPEENNEANKSTDRRSEEKAQDKGFGLATDGSGARRSRRDPQRIGSITNAIVKKNAWEREISAGSLLSKWPQIVGSTNSQHTKIEEFTDGKLVVRAETTAWSQQLRLLIPQIMRNIDQEIGPNVVEQIIIVGPTVRSWKHGPRSVRGRGPRDTYG